MVRGRNDIWTRILRRYPVAWNVKNILGKGVLGVRKILSLILSLTVLFFAAPLSAAQKYAEGEAIALLKTGVSSTGVSSAKQALPDSVVSAAAKSGAELVHTFIPVPAASSSLRASAAKSSAPGGELLTAALFRAKEGESTKALIKRLKENPDVVCVTPNYLMSPLSDTDANIPNDPMWPEQWGLQRIRLPEVWAYGTGSEEVVVAVVDTGIIYDHPDLKDNMFVFSRDVVDAMRKEYFSIINNDFIGSHGIWYHARFISMDGWKEIAGVPVGPGDTSQATSRDIDRYDDIEKMRVVGDIRGHGTHVAGIIGALGNNNEGVAGVGWKVKMMAVNVFSKDSISREARLSDVMRGLDFITVAKRAGVNIRVVNLSLGWSARNEFFEAKIKQLSDAGIIICAGAGNNGVDFDDDKEDDFDFEDDFGAKAAADAEGENRHLVYPACYRVANMISVGSSTSGDLRAGSSNYSSTGKWVDIFAPGDGILSTCRSTPIFRVKQDIWDVSGYRVASGTSMATPMVAGAAALLCSLYPEKSASEIRTMLLEGANKNILREGYSGYGMLDVLAAYDYAAPQPSPQPTGGGSGCAAGFGVLALAAAALVPFILRANKRR